MKKYLLSLPLLLLIFIAGCQKGQMEGPELTDLYGPFAVVESLSVSQDTVDFAEGESLTMMAEFSKRVNWKLTLTGQNTGAQKIISDFSKTLSIENARWNGSTTTLPFFQAEAVEIVLTVEGELDTMMASATTVSTITYDGILIADFETPIEPGPNSFYQAGVFFFEDNSSHVAGEGEYFFNMRGTVPWDWLIGMVELTAATTTETTTFPVSANPNEVYFNIMVYGQSSTPESRLEVQFREDENGNGTFEGATEDLISTPQTIVNWDGWKMLSFRYSDLQPDAGVTNGNGVLNPDKIHSLTVLLLAPKEADSPSGLPNPGVADIDYLIFTQGGPLLEQ